MNRVEKLYGAVILAIVLTCIAILWTGTSTAGGPQAPLEYVSELSMALQQLEAGTATWEAFPGGSALHYTDSDSTPRAIIIGDVDMRRLDLVWDAPTTNVDGTPVTDIAGFIFLAIGFQTLPMEALAGSEVRHSIWWPRSMDFDGRVAAYDTAGNFSTWGNSLEIEAEEGQ